MSIVEFSTRRRVAIAMVMVAMVLFGLVGLSRLDLNLLPDVSYPTLTVRTEYEGAAPAEIENLLTKPIEEAVGVVKNVQLVHSVSMAEQSDVILEFAWGTDMDLAGLEVREKLEVLQLPLEAERPTLLRFNPSTEPVMRLALARKSEDEDTGEDEDAGEDQGEGQDEAESSRAALGFDEDALKVLRRYGDDELKKFLEATPGVAAVKISGGLEDEIQVDIDQQKLAQLGLSAQLVAARLRQENVNLSGGSLDEGTQRFLVRTINQFSNIGEIADVIIATEDGRPVFLRDVAVVRHGYKEREAIIRIDGEEAVEIAVYKEGDVNTVQVARRVERQLQRLEEEEFLPDDMRLETVYNQATFITQAISSVKSAAYWGGVLAILVLYFFLRNARPTLIVAVSIPVSITATFFLMYFFDLSLNIMSLGGIALAIGLLVDNAIVVLENIDRHRQMGKSIIDSAVDGGSEVSSAVIASTLTTICVFLPLVFVEGIGGQLFKDQALTVTFALIISLLVALTLIPMLASLGVRSKDAFPEETFDSREPRTRIGRWMRAVRIFIFDTLIGWIVRIFTLVFGLIAKGLHWFFKPFVWFTNKSYDLLAAIYARTLPWALDHRATVVIVAGAIFGFSLLLIRGIGVELIPEFTQGEFDVQYRLAPGTPLNRTDEAMQRVASMTAELDGVRLVFSVAGSGNRLDASPTESGENTGTMKVALVPGASDAVETRVVRAMREELRRLPDVEAKFGRPELFSFQTPMEVQILGYDLGGLANVSNRIATVMEESDRFADVKSTMEEGHPEVQIRFDQERAALLGLTVREISDHVVRKVRGEVATRYSWRDRKIDVLVRVPEEERASLEDIERIIVNPESDRPVTLAAVAEITVTYGPAQIRRSNQERVAVVSANLNYGDLGSAVAEVRGIIRGIPMPAGIGVRVGGQNEEMERSFRSLQIALAIAIFLVYLVMASQFESLIQPLVILFTIPLAAVGAILSLYVTGTPLSIVVFIGLIMLTGIVVNNAIVMIDLINQLRDKGMDRIEAIKEGARMRLRPIVMTTLTTILGLTPMAIGIGEGAEIRTPMAITVMGGLLVSTMLTLLVIPVVYSLLDRGKRVRVRKQGTEPVPAEG